MIMPNRFFSFVLMCLSLLVLLAGLTPAWALPDTPWRVKTVHFNPLTQRQGEPFVWTYAVTEDGSDWATVTVTDTNKGTGYGAELQFHKNRLVQATLLVPSRKGRIALEHDFDPQSPALVPGSLAPCDWPNASLPFEVKEERVTATRDSAAGSIAREMIVRGEKIDPDTARQMGMLTDENDGLAEGQLLLLRIYDVQAGKGELSAVVTQLWVQNGAFWLYEESRYRKSWRIAK